MEAKQNYSRLLLLWMIVAFLFGGGIFLAGFFPINNYAIETANDTGRPQNLDGLKLTAPKKLYTQTILMLVDALRADFPTPITMPFSYSKSCYRLQLHVNIPTVTMPRLKSLTTGTVSNFIDIVLNIGHVEQLKDSLIHRLHERNHTAVFAGDRTWQSLFPKQFKRLNANRDSFFVNDFYEGDKNVTEVLSQELQHTDWMLLVLHYLGLDHIGHVEGTQSVKIPLKLKEMDDVILKIYETKRFHSQLLLLTGDHGMKDGGGHGGSTTGEIYVPLFVLKENCSAKSFSYNSETYNQIDVAPTLAVLWSIEIPPMSIGCLIPELLSDYSLEEQLYAYYYNTLHLIRKAKHRFDKEDENKSVLAKWYAAAKSAHKQFLLTKRSERFDNAYLFENAKINYLRLSKELSKQLAHSLVQFDYGLIGIGLMLTTMVVLHTLLVFYLKNLRSFAQGKTVCLSVIAFTMFIYIWCQYEGYINVSGLLNIFFVLLAISQTTYLNINMANMLWKQLLRKYTTYKDFTQFSYQVWLLMSCLVFHIISLTSSSYIEMERKTWHYLGASALILLTMQDFHKNVCSYKAFYKSQVLLGFELYNGFMRTFYKKCSTWLLIGGLGFLERLHDVAFYMNKLWLSCFFGAGWLLFSQCMHQKMFVQTRTELFLYNLAALLVYCYRSAVGTLWSVVDTSYCAHIFLQLFWFIAAIAICVGLTSTLRTGQYKLHPVSLIAASLSQVLLNFMLALSLLLHKPHNSILVAYLIYMLALAYEMCEKLQRKTPPNLKYLQKLLYTIIVGNMFYFYQGNSNSFATIDLNPGYIGQTTYKPIIVGILVTLNMYSAYFIAFLYLITHILRSVSDGGSYSRVQSDFYAKEHINFILYAYTLSILVPVLVYFWLLIAFRYHLFIYSVFAPKALYEYYRVIVVLITFLMTTINTFVIG